MDVVKFKGLVKDLYRTVDQLESMFPGRHFTPDGHLLGSIGEAIVAAEYNLELEPASNKGFDAKTVDGKKVEIKATQAKSVSFRSCPDYAIVIQIFEDGSYAELYNGPGHLIWSQFHNRKKPSNGQYQIVLNKLIQLNKSVQSEDKIRKWRRP